MEDVLSYKSSSDSMSTSGEFEIVAKSSGSASAEKKVVGTLPLNPTTAMTSPQSISESIASPGALLATSPPTLNIANNGDMVDLEQNLKEMIREIEKSPMESDTPSSTGKRRFSSLVHNILFYSLYIDYVMHGGQ